MVSCVLCLKDISLFENFFDLHSNEGRKLKIFKILNTIFNFLQLNSEIKKNERICCDCWNVVKSFNSFYQRILSAHESVTTSLPLILDDADDDIDPISNGNFAKSLDNSSFSDVVNGQINEFSAINEIKVEVNELDMLPSIEVLENPVNSNNQESLSPPPPKKDFLINSTNASAKRIKFGESISKVVAEIINDSDSDVPLSDYLSIDLKTDRNNDKPTPPIKLTNDTNDTKCLKRKRGRPRKIRQTEAECEPITCEAEQEAESDSRKCEARKDSHTHFSYSTNDDDDGSNDSWRCDTLREERYAEMPKGNSVKPKKYRIRKKPRVPAVRISREEMDKRQALQKEYDDIIEKFFNKFPCPVCNLLVENFSDLKRHFRVSHDIESGYMSCCGRKFHLRKVLAEHVLVHWNPDHFKCDTCKRIFQDSRSLELHENAHKNPESKDNKKIYQCEKCPKSFKTKPAFEYHSHSKHVPISEFKFSCKECNKKLPTERKLKDHMKHVHDPESAIICDKCGKQVRSQTSLKNHHRLEHSDEPRPPPIPMQCEICGTWLRHLSSLKQHMKTIHEEAGGDHRCHICNKSSTNARALKRHIYHNHECERKFKCTMCVKAFKRPQDLREHKSTHTGEALYTCPNCPMTFFSNANMYKHRQRLHRAEWEADRKKPNVNIMRQAVGATAATRLREAAATEKIDYFVKATTCSVTNPETTQ